METPRSRDEVDERGFTLLELMVVVLIIAVILAIAVPTFLGAQRRASDRAAQSDARTAHVTELIVYSDAQRFTEDVDELKAVDSSLAYTQVLTAMRPRSNVIYVEMLPPTDQPDDTVLVGAKSGSGRCFWIRTTGDSQRLRFADNDCTAIPGAGSYRDEW